MLKFVLLGILASSLQVNENKQLTKIAFGSCANQFDQTYPEIFYSIAAWEPDIFVWLGDTVYADTFSVPFKFEPASQSRWNRKYQNFKSMPEYQNLINTTMITGIWDDHDYGINNGNKSFPLKSLSKSLFLEFVDDGHNRNHEGIYHSFRFNDVKLILLDTRWFRDSVEEADGDTLGEEQWIWLGNEMKSKEKLKVIISGIQINTHDRRGFTERWHDRSRQRLWKLINEHHGVVLLSGDVHYAEILKVPCVDYESYEITSSGLTHCVQTMHGIFATLFISLFSPYNFNIGPKVLSRNFGTLEIDWDAEILEVCIRNPMGQAEIIHTISLKSLYNKHSSDNCIRDRDASIAKHVFFSMLIFVVPPLLCLLSLLVFLRKHSNSY